MRPMPTMVAMTLCATLQTASHAQGSPVAQAPALSCPNNVMRLIVPWSAGGATDVAARYIALPLSQRLGLSVVVENKAGAGGTIGTADFVREKPDGCTLLVATSSTNAAAPYLYAHTGFDPAKDFTPIAFVSSIPNILVVGASSPYKSVSSLVAAAKAAPGKLTYGTGGSGSSQHLAGAMFKSIAQIDIVHVPYRSSAPAVIDLMGDHINMVMDTGSLSHIRGGKVRALAVASKKRLGILPDVPTFDEAGVPGLYFTFWIGIMGPAGMPKATVDRLNAELNAAIASPTTQKQLVEMGGEVGPGDSESFGRFAQAELKRYADIVRVSGAKLEQ